jgi:hypothetical protein
VGAARSGLPNPLSVVERLDVVTGPLAYFPLLGDREAVDALTPTPDHIIIDWGSPVAADAQTIRVRRQPVPVVAFVNNHFAGYAPETVRQFVALTDPAAPAGRCGP